MRRQRANRTFSAVEGVHCASPWVTNRSAPMKALYHAVLVILLFPLLATRALTQAVPTPEVVPTKPAVTCSDPETSLACRTFKQLVGK